MEVVIHDPQDIKEFRCYVKYEAVDHSDGVYKARLLNLPDVSFPILAEYRGTEYIKTVLRSILKDHLKCCIEIPWINEIKIPDGSDIDMFIVTVELEDEPAITEVKR